MQIAVTLAVAGLTFSAKHFLPSYGPCVFISDTIRFAWDRGSIG